MPEQVEQQATTAEKVWNNFWADICLDENGNVDMEQVKKELADFRFMIKEVPKVYSHVTGGLLSKPMYHAEGVIEKADEYYEEELEFYKEEEMELEREEIVEKIESVMQTEGSDLNRVSIPKREWEELKNEILGQR
jgi:hypothetical protein